MLASQTMSGGPFGGERNRHTAAALARGASGVDRSEYSHERLRQFGHLELTDEQLARDEAYRAETGKDFPTIEIRAKKGEEPRWGGKKLVKVALSHPSVACEQKAGARLIVVDEDGMNYAWPESWPCSAEEDEQASEAVKFKRSLALLQFYHSYLHATNELKRLAAVKEVSDLLRKILTKKWIDDLGTRCLKATIARQAAVPSDISSAFEKRQWLKVAAAKPSETIAVKRHSEVNDGFDTDPSLLESSEAATLYVNRLTNADEYARRIVALAIDEKLDIAMKYSIRLQAEVAGASDAYAKAAGAGADAGAGRAKIAALAASSPATTKEYGEIVSATAADLLSSETTDHMRLPVYLARAAVQLAAEFLEMQLKVQSTADAKAFATVLAGGGEAAAAAAAARPVFGDGAYNASVASALYHQMSEGSNLGNDTEREVLTKFIHALSKLAFVTSLATKLNANNTDASAAEGGGVLAVAGKPAATYENAVNASLRSPKEKHGLILAAVHEGRGEKNSATYEMMPGNIGVTTRATYLQNGTQPQRMAMLATDDEQIKTQALTLCSLAPLGIFQCKRQGEARETWVKRGLPRVEVNGGWMGCAKLSDAFARAVLDASLDSISQQVTEWVSGMDERLKEGVNETMLVRQEVLMTLTQKMAESIKAAAIDPSLMPELLSALKIARDASFFQIADPNLLGEEKKEDERAAKASEEEWSKDFLARATRAAELNAKNPGTLRYAERKADCDDEGGVFLDENDTEKAYCAPNEIGRLRASMENKFASKEERIRNAQFKRLLQAVKASVQGDADKERAFVRQLTDKSGAQVEQGLLQELEEDVDRIERRSGLQGTRAAREEDAADRARGALTHKSPRSPSRRTRR